MADIREKIAKLLALADSPNENEAKAALLKARKLMAENKLLEADINGVREPKVVKKTIGIMCSGQKDTWAAALSGVIAKHYCCVAYRLRKAGERKIEIGFCGLEEDFEICVQAFRFAYDCIKYYCEHNIPRESDGTHVAYRKRCNSYGWGFVIGVQEALNKQEEEHQEWGLVMVVPQAVMNEFAGKKPTSYGRNTSEYGEYKRRGYVDGKNFNPGVRMVIE